LIKVAILGLNDSRDFQTMFLAPLMTSSWTNEAISQWLQQVGAEAYSTLTDIPAIQNRVMNLTHDATDDREDCDTGLIPERQ
jgi:hypothetical protein